MSSNKTIVKNSFLLYVNLVITSILGLLATRFLLNYLGISDYGLYSVVGSVVVIMNFFNTVMVTTTYRYIAFELGRNYGRDVNKVFNISLVIHFVMVLLILIFAETIGVWYITKHINIYTSKLNDALFVFRFSIWAAIFGIISVPYQGFLTAVEKFNIRVMIDVLKAVLSFSVVIFIGIVTLNRLRLYAILITTIALISAFLYIFYCRKYYNSHVKWNLQKDREKYKEMIGFSGWTAIGAAAYVGKDTGSQLILNSFFGTILNASFGIANMINSFIKLFANNLSQVAIPQITKSYSAAETTRTLKLVTYVSKYSFLLMCIPSIPILLTTKFILNFWLGYVPNYSIAFCQLMIVNALVDSLSAGVPAAVQASGKIKWFQIISSSIMLFSLPIAYFCFKNNQPPFSIIIIYISTAVINMFVGVYLLNKILQFDIAYYIKNAHYRALNVIISVFPLFYINTFFEIFSITRFVIVSMASLLWLLIVIFYVGLDKNERSILLKYIDKIIRNNFCN